MFFCICRFVSADDPTLTVETSYRIGDIMRRAYEGSWITYSEARRAEQADKWFQILGYTIFLGYTFIFSDFFVTSKLTCFFILQEILYVGPVLRCRRPEEVRHEGCEHIEEGPL